MNEHIPLSPEDFDAGRIADLLERCGERIGGGEPNTFTDEIYDAVDRLRAIPPNTQQSSDMVERRGAIRNVLYRHLPTKIDANVCRAIADYLLALEACHHAKLAAENARLREQLYEAEERVCQLEVALRKLRSLVAMYVKDAPAIQETDKLLAKIGCDI